MSLHREEVEILKRRSIEFLKGARMALEGGLYDLSCFLAEQALQLYLKAVMLELVGEYPRTHSIRRLLGELNRVLKSRELEDFVRINRTRLSVLEDAYLIARYFVKEYSEEDAKDLLELVEETVELIKRIMSK
ncbi:MAG: HEPN domain-containing protein [Thermoprotei archaeon]